MIIHVKKIITKYASSRAIKSNIIKLKYGSFHKRAEALSSNSTHELMSLAYYAINEPSWKKTHELSWLTSYHSQSQTQIKEKGCVRLSTANVKLSQIKDIIVLFFQLWRISYPPLVQFSLTSFRYNFFPNPKKLKTWPKMHHKNLNIR